MIDPLEVFYPVDRRQWITGPGPMTRVCVDGNRPLLCVAVDPDNVARIIQGSASIARLTLALGPSGGYVPAGSPNGSCAPLAYGIAVLFDDGRGVLEHDMPELGLRLTGTAAALNDLERGVSNGVERSAGGASYAGKAGGQFQKWMKRISHR